MPFVLEHRGRALLEQLRVVVLRVAVDLDDRALRVAVVGERLGQGLALLLADLGAVELGVGGEIRVQDQPVIADHRDVGLLRAGDHPRRRGRVDRVEDDHVDALGDRGLDLRLLLGRVLVGVLVEDVAVRAELLRPSARTAACPGSRSAPSASPAAGRRSCRCRPSCRCRCRRRRSPHAPSVERQRRNRRPRAAASRVRFIAFIRNILLVCRTFRFHLLILPLSRAGLRRASCRFKHLTRPRSRSSGSAKRSDSCITSASAPSSSARSPSTPATISSSLDRARDRVAARRRRGSGRGARPRRRSDRRRRSRTRGLRMLQRLATATPIARPASPISRWAAASPAGGELEQLARSRPARGGWR